MANVFQPRGGYLTGNEALADAAAAAAAPFARAIERKRASAREMEMFLLQSEPEAASKMIEAMGEQGLRRFGIKKARAAELAATVAGGELVRDPTTAELETRRTGAAETVSKEQKAAADVRAAGVQKTEIREGLLDAKTNQPLDEGRRNFAMRAVEAGEPLPPNITFSPEIVAAAEQAGFGDDVGAYLAGQREIQGGKVREARAGAAAAEQQALAAGANFGILEPGATSPRRLTSEELTLFATDPFHPDLEGLMLPDEYEQQVDAWARTFFGGDEDKATRALAALTYELPTDQAKQAILSSKANQAYMAMLTEKLAAEMIASGNPTMTAEQQRLALKDLRAAYQNSVGLGGRLQKVTGKMIDPETNQPKLGFFGGEKGAKAQGVPEAARALTIEDMTSLTVPAAGESATDRNVIIARLENLIAEKLPGVIDVEDFSVWLDQVDKDGNPIRSKEYNLEEFILVLSKARVEGQRFRELSTRLGFDLGTSEPAGLTEGRARVQGQPARLRRQEDVTGGSAIDAATDELYGDEFEALRKAAGR